MPPALATDPILKHFRAALDEIYGYRLERVVLFGSKARGDAGEDSDYDIAVFLKNLKEGDLDTRRRELYRVQFENHGPGARPIADPRVRLVQRTRDYGFQTGRG